MDKQKHEVFPKQTSVNAEGFGNLVKLPFQFNNRTKTRSQILKPDTFEPMERQQAIEYLISLPDSDIHSVFEKLPKEEAKKNPTFQNSENMGLDNFEPEPDTNDLKGFLSNPKIKPCVVKAYQDKWSLHGIGSEGNSFRYAVATELITWGATNKTIHEYFQLQKDYDAKTTETQLSSIRRKGEINSTGCKKIKDLCPSLIGDMCDACTYYLKQKPKKERQTKPKTLNTDDVEALSEGLGVYRTIRQLADEAQKVQPIHYDEYRNYWLWEKRLKYWRRIDETTIICVIDKMCSENVIESKLKSEILTAFQVTGRNRELKPVPKEWLRFNDVVYDLKNKNTFEPTHEYFYTAPIPHNLGTSEDTPTIDAIFKSWVSNPIDLVEIAAYCLLDDYPIHRMFILLGSGGNGKGQEMEFLTRLVGANNTTSTDLVTILTSRFEAVKLYRKKLALIGETNYEKINSTDKLKKITGDDLLQGEFKHKDPFDFKNTAKVVISSNDLPETTDKTDGFYRRANVIEFRNHFDDKGKSIIDTIPEKEYENFCYKLCKVLVKLLESGRFTNEGTTQEKAEKYEKLSNPFGRFKDLELIEDVDSDTPVWIITELYNSFCAKNGYRKISKTETTQKLKEMGFEVKPKRFGYKTYPTVFGLKTKTPFILEDELYKNDDGNVRDVRDVRPLPNNSPIREKLETALTTLTTLTNPQDLSQQTAMKSAVNLILNHYGYQPISENAMIEEAANLKNQIPVSKEQALEYIKRACDDIQHGRI